MIKRDTIRKLLLFKWSKRDNHKEQKEQELYRLEAEHQNIKRLRANLDKRQALHEDREARLENAENEIAVYKQNIEKRAFGVFQGS